MRFERPAVPAPPAELVVIEASQAIAGLLAEVTPESLVAIAGTVAAEPIEVSTSPEVRVPIAAMESNVGIEVTDCLAIAKSSRTGICEPRLAAVEVFCAR